MSGLDHLFEMHIPLDTVVDIDLPALVQTLVEAIQDRVEDERDPAVFAAWRDCEKAAMHFRDAAEELYEVRGIGSRSPCWW